MTKKMFRKTKLKTMQRKQRIEKRIITGYRAVDKCDRLIYEKLPVMKAFDFKQRTQDWNPEIIEGLDTTNERFYIPDKLQSFCEYLKDLFCIEHNILLDMRYKKNANTGKCFYNLVNGHQRIFIGARGGLRATTLIHEFLHGAGFDHEREINGYSNFVTRGTHDTYSRLVCKDIFGKYEVLLI